MSSSGLLRMVAQRLRDACTDDDTAARIGGDEFALIMPERPATEVNALIAHLERQVVSFRGASQHASRRRSRPADTG